MGLKPRSLLANSGNVGKLLISWSFVLPSVMSVSKRHHQDVPGGPLVKTLCSQCRGHAFNPWSRNWISHDAMKIKDPICYN